jgi:hypothetical protein
LIPAGSPINMLEGVLYYHLFHVSDPRHSGLIGIVIKDNF